MPLERYRRGATFSYRTLSLIPYGLRAVLKIRKRGHSIFRDTNIDEWTASDRKHTASDRKPHPIRWASELLDFFYLHVIFLMQGSGRDFTSGVSEPQKYGEVNRITLFVISVTFFLCNYKMNNIRYPTALLQLENRTASNAHLEDEQHQTHDHAASVRKPHSIKWSSERHYFFCRFSTIFHLTHVCTLFPSFFFLFGVLGFHIGELYTCKEVNCMVEGNETQHNSKWTSLVNNFQTSPYNFYT